jgi:metallo-beta-lactamase family protein
MDAGTLALTFLGAAGTVTGSKSLLELPGRHVLVDCGLYQGERAWRRLNWEAPAIPARDVEAVVLTHAHLDHCGYLPALVRQGFSGPVYVTESTAALAAIVLRDSARLHEEEATFAQESGYSKHHPPLPLYTSDDAERTISAFEPRAFDAPFDMSGAKVTFNRAGHILGSACALVESGRRSVLFSGDLGRPSHPMLVPRSRPPAARTVVLEATYGDRVHPEAGREHEKMAAAIRRTIGRGGTVVIPAFAVDRTEIVLLALAELAEQGEIPDVPVHVDSPMALQTLAVYRSPAFAEEVQADRFEALRSLHHLAAARTPDESRRLDDLDTPSIIVSASGMATGGRVVHHLRALLPERRNTVVLTGYQAMGTRGRALQDGAHEVKIQGHYVRVRAEVVTDGGFSVHADSKELLGWLLEMPEPPQTVYIVHGEPPAAEALAERIRSACDCSVAVARLGERVLVD